MLKIINARILFSFTVLLVAAAVIIGATLAFFSDTETSPNNTLTAGAIDLKIDNTSYYNGVLNSGTTWEVNDLTNQLFFNFNDVKPSDLGEDTISFHADNDYWLCAQTTLTENNDNTCTEPEKIDDSTCQEPNTDPFDGELAQNINFIFWADDGDNVLEKGEKVFKTGTAQSVLDNSLIPLADSVVNNLGGADGQPATGGVTQYIGKAWCFGTLSETPVPVGLGVSPTVNGGVTCNGTFLNNATQTDKVLADIKFDAVQSRNNPGYVCGGRPSPTPTLTPIPTPTLTPTPTPAIACGENDVIYASSASDNDQGLRKNSTAVLPDRSVLSQMFGAPQTSGNPSDTVTPNSFFALGFPLGGNTASVVLGFAEPFYNGPTSQDLFVYEVTGGTYPDEKVKIEASANPGGPWTVLAASAARDEAVDLGSLTSAQYVRLTDVSDINLFETTADGYDVDAVKAFCTDANN